jgi:hypothetical protein
MATVTKWSGVAIAMQSALGAVKTITAIDTAGATGVVTGTHDFSSGDYVIITCSSTTQLNGRVFRVLSVSTTVSFVVEGTGAAALNMTGYNAFVTGTGTVQKITFGTSITTATSVSGGEAGSDMIDTTTIHDTIKSEVPGAQNPISYSFDNIWDPADGGQIAMKAASDSQAVRAFRFTFGTGGKIMVFAGYVGFSGAPGGTAQDKVTTGSTISAQGSPTFYAS